MNRSRRTRKPGSDEDSSFTIQQGVLMATIFLALALTVQATQPGWWTAPGGPLNSNPPNDYAVANVGQLKQFTEKAVLYMDTNLPGGAGTTLDTMVTGWSNYYATNGYTSTNPAPADFQAANLGQLRYIASLVYSQLSSAGYTGLYPSWINLSTNNDYAAANLGQLETVFNFDLLVAPAAVSGLTASTNNPGEIDLSWTLPAMNNATSIVLEQSTDGGTTWTTLGSPVDSTATNYADVFTSPPPGEVLYRVTPQNSTGSAPTTTTTTAVAPPPPVPLPPSSLNGMLGTNSVMNLSWPASTWATSYEVDRETLNGTGTWTTLTSTVTTTSYADSSRSTAVGYHYQVKAITSAGTSSPSVTFPQPRYAIIDLGPNVQPSFLNNQGSVVMNGTFGSGTFWKAGVTNSIPLDEIVGLDNNDRVAGSLWGDAVPDRPTLDPDTGTSLPVTTVTSMAATWSPGSSTATDLQSPYTAILAAPADYNGTIGGSGVTTDNCNFAYSATALSDTTVVGSASLSTFYYDPDGFDYLTAPYYFMDAISFGDGGVLWDNSAQLVQTFTHEWWSRYIEYEFLAAHDIFTPSGVNNAGTMIGKDEHFDYAYAPDATETDRYAICSGSTLTTLAFHPTSINNTGTVVGDNVGLGGGTPTTGFIYGSTQQLTHGAVKINNNGGAHGQILDNAGWLWNYDSTSSLYQPTNIADYTADTSPWSNVGPLLSDISTLTSLNDNGAIVGTATYTGTATTAGSHGVMLAPVIISQSNYPIPSPTNSTMDSGAPTVTKIINSSDANGIALITGAAVMPQLTAKINGLDSSGMSVDWSLSVTSERSERGTQDNISIPPAGGSSSVINVPINTAWNIAASYPAAPQEVFGGNVTISYQIKKADGTYLMAVPQTMTFKIMGLNPTPDQAHTYIQAEPLAVSTFYYAWAVAKHESAQDKFSSIYCQFNAGGPKIELPNYSADGANGWGIFQRDDTGGGIAVTTDQVYSWKVNSDVAVQQELLEKWNVSNTYLGTVGSSPPTYTTGNGTVFSALDTLTIERYNGASGRSNSQLLIYTPTNPPGVGVGKQWRWNLPNAVGDTKPYIDRVAERMSTSP